jgi:hypothetical protein
MAPQPFRPVPLVHLPELYDHADCLFEVKHDGFRALAHIEGSRRVCGKLAHAATPDARLDYARPSSRLSRIAAH